MTNTKPTSNKTAILDALHVLFDPTDVIEVRAFTKAGKKRTDAGYFDSAHWPELADHAAKLSASGAAVYITLNPVDPQLLGRYNNRMEAYATATTTDKQITRRRWLLVDLDPVRPAHTSATDTQFKAAHVKAQVIYKHLKGSGWAEPLVAESGNGFHLLYPVDLPNDEDSTGLIKNVLMALAERFDDADVKVDRGVFNAARICKLYGTVANKGDHTDTAPWRLSQLICTPVRELVTVEQLRQMGSTVAKPVAPKTIGQRNAGSFNLEDFLTRHGLVHTAGMHDGRERFKLASCPFNSEHGNGEAAIFRDSTGKLGFKCQHDSCSGKNWQSLRDLLDGPRQQRATQTGDDAAHHKVIESESGDEGRSDEWPELEPLIAKTEAKPYPVDALPPLLRDAVMEVNDFVKAPVSLVAMSALAALSVAIQAHVDVQRAEHLEGPCGLYLCGIADSGERKTSIDNTFTKVIHDYQARQLEIHKPLMQAYETELEVLKARRGAIQEKIKSTTKEGNSTGELEAHLHELDNERPMAPRLPRLLYSDATPEALGLALATGWPSGGVFSNEGGIVVGGHGMSKEVVMRNMARLNSFWDGKVPATDRVTSEGYGEVSARMTISILIQEPTFRAFFDNSKGLARGSGFLARFLVAWPESTMGTRMFDEPEQGWPALTAFKSRLTAILDRNAPVDDNGVLTPAMLKLSPQAKALWVAFHDEVEATLGTGGELCDLRDLASKAADNVVRMAALFHVFAGGDGPIDEDCVQSAVQIVTWHLLEAKRFFGELAISAELANPIRLEKWLLDYCKRGGIHQVATQKVQQCGPSGLREKAIIDATVNELAELGRARMVRLGKRKLIQIRPELLVAAS
jgi:putative DNA primase/helicase